MALPITAKNVEIYVFNTTSDFNPFSGDNKIAVDENIMTFLDAEKTASRITNIRKISAYSNEVSVEPQEDTTETTNHMGTTASGAQNSSVNKTINSDVDITILTENSIDVDLNDYILAVDATEVGGTGDTNYKRYNLGSSSTDSVGMFFKIEKLVNGVYYYKNYLVVTPEPKTPKGFAGSADDVSLTNEYAFLGAKSKVIYDQYNRATQQTSVNFD